jgi:hypothetical protein
MAARRPSRSSDNGTSSCLRRPHTAALINSCREQTPPLFLRCPSACRPLNDSRISQPPPALLGAIEISPLPEVPAAMSPTTFTKSPSFCGLHFVSYDRP